MRLSVNFSCHLPTTAILYRHTHILIQVFELILAKDTFYVLRSISNIKKNVYVLTFSFTSRG